MTVFFGKDSVLTVFVTVFSSDWLVHGKGICITHRWFEEEAEFWIGKKICILLSGDTKT